MAKRRPSGDGMVRKRDDGRWEGRIVVGHKENGESIFRYIYADTQKELTAKLRSRSFERMVKRGMDSVDSGTGESKILTGARFHSARLLLHRADHRSTPRRDLWSHVD